jgi:cell division septal protein FtsQ
MQHVTYQAAYVTGIYLTLVDCTWFVITFSRAISRVNVESNANVSKKDFFETLALTWLIAREIL